MKTCIVCKALILETEEQALLTIIETGQTSFAHLDCLLFVLPMLTQTEKDSINMRLEQVKES